MFVMFSAFQMIAAQTAEKTTTPKDFYELTKTAPAAYLNGDLTGAKTKAEQLLIEANSWKQDWNYGNAIHVGNMVLGLVALKEGKIEEAKKSLLAAGKTPGSPQLNSFGPNMLLAKGLLEAGEKDTVVEYLDLCAKFWRPKSSRVDEWKSDITAGQMPDFGANLRYQGF